MEPNDHWGIVGHGWAVRSLRRAVASGGVSHAYLFTGPPGVGKTTLARALAAALLCQAEQEEPPCGACRACRLVASGNHPDLHVLESERVGASLKIEQVRELQRQLALTPLEGRRKIAILRRFEEATTSAANALLKTLEEPPPYVVLAVLAADADRLLPTIVSRCQQVPLRPLPASLVQRALVERWGAPSGRAELLAHLSGGRLGWAVHALDDDAAMKRRARRLDDVDRLLGASVVERFRYAEKLARNPVATQETLDLWIGWWRDVTLVAAGAEAVLTNVDRQSALSDHARRFGVERSAAVVRALRSATERLGRNANSRLTLEVLMLDLPRG
jgi:DNA polymerase-3 subunit delta'